jgi:hypothetical protein
VAYCQNGSFSVGFIETGCQIGGGCAGAGGPGGVGGGGGIGGAGGVGGAFGIATCPATQPTAGFSCAGGEFGLTPCQYGSTTCCGLTYPTVAVTCQQDTVVQEALGNPCTLNPSYVCPTGGVGGTGTGGSGSGGSGGATFAAARDAQSLPR